MPKSVLEGDAQMWHLDGAIISLTWINGSRERIAQGDR
jgi:hypothetical protein